MKLDAVARGQSQPKIQTLPAQRAFLRGGVGIELVGPPGSGKTTLARAVAAELQRLGIAARLAISARPEESANARGSALALRMAKVVGAVSQVVRRDPVTDSLMQLMPMTGWSATLRRRRYIAGLAAFASAEGLLVQDQGYLCAIAGLALDSGRVDPQLLTDALNLVPLPLIAVRVRISHVISALRLGQRHAKQGFAARVLERAPTDNRRLDDIFDMIGAKLAEQGRCVLDVSGHDQRGLEAAVTLITSAVQARHAVPLNRVALP